MSADRPQLPRALVVCPTWLGDAVMATPALRLLRAGLPGAFLGGLCRPAAQQVLAGLEVFDEVHPAPAGGIMAPKVAAQRVRTRRYTSALLLTNSFSTALSTRLAGIPLRMGFNRDGRGMLLTDALPARLRRDSPPFDRSPTNPGGYPPDPIAGVYESLARAFLERLGVDHSALARPTLRLAVTDAEARAGGVILAAAHAADDTPFAVLNPGGNNLAKRWPADRFAYVAAWLIRDRGLAVLINGSPAEADLCADIAARARKILGPHAQSSPGISASPPVASLTELGGSIGSLKAILCRAAILITNDTGPRHVAAAFGTPVVTLFGPTDPRWTTLTPWLPPRRDGKPIPLEVELAADPSLPEEEVADDHPERCRVDRIETAAVIEAAERLLG